MEYPHITFHSSNSRTQSHYLFSINTHGHYWLNHRPHKNSSFQVLFWFKLLNLPYWPLTCKAYDGFRPKPAVQFWIHLIQTTLDGKNNHPVIYSHTYWLSRFDFSMTLREIVSTAIRASWQAWDMRDGGRRKPYSPWSWSSKEKTYLMPWLKAQSVEPPEATSGEKGNRIEVHENLTTVIIKNTLWTDQSTVNFTSNYDDHVLIVNIVLCSNDTAPDGQKLYCTLCLSRRAVVHLSLSVGFTLTMNLCFLGAVLFCFIFTAFNHF